MKNALLLVLAILISGISLNAQDNPCIENGPTYGEWDCGNPTFSDGYVSTVPCVKKSPGSSVSFPAPEVSWNFARGSKTRTVTYRCQASFTETSQVSYVVGEWYYNQDLPANPSPGTYTRQVLVDVESDDPDCSFDNTYTVGTVTWTVEEEGDSQDFCISSGYITDVSLGQTVFTNCVGSSFSPPYPSYRLVSGQFGFYHTNACPTSIETITNDLAYEEWQVIFADPAGNAFPTEFNEPGVFTCWVHVVIRKPDPGSPPVCSDYITNNAGSFTVHVQQPSTNTICAKPGTVNVGGTLSPNGAVICSGDSVTLPEVTMPTLNDGEIHTTIFQCPDATSTTLVTSVSYTLGELEWVPSEPGSFSSPGTYTYTAKVTATPSDTNCLPFDIVVGTFTVTVSAGPTVTDVCGKAGSVNTGGTVSPNGAVICIGESFEMPQVTMPTFNDGELHTTTIECPGGNSTTTVTPVGYEAGNLRWEPAIPGSFSTPGTYSFTATVTAVPGDSECEPFDVEVGTFSVTVAAAPTTTNICGSAGSVNTQGSLSPNGASICVGGSAGLPSVIMPTLNNGEKHTITVLCPSGNSTTEVTTVSYVAQNLRWEPPFPSSFPSAGTFGFAAKITAVPSDNVCQPFDVTIGTFTVTVGGAANTTNYCGSAGSVNTGGSINPSGAAVCVNGSVETPEVVLPTFNDGEKHTVAIDCPGGSSTTTVDPVGYTAENLRWEPAIPGSFTSPGTYSFTAKITATPGDSVCEPFDVTVGTFTVVVSDTPITTNVCGRAGSVNTGGTISPNGVAICVDGSASAPTVIFPTFTDGEKHTITIQCPSGSTSTDINPVGYSAQNLRWDPAIPTSFDTEGTFTFTAKITATPSDSVCEPFDVTIGTFTVTVTNSESITEVCGLAGSVKTPGSLSPTNIMLCVGGSADVPSVTDPTFNPGEKHTITLSCPGGTTTIVTNPVEYSLTNVVWDPPFPGVFSNAGSYTFTVRATAQPSDPVCDPFPVTIGSFSVWVTNGWITNFTCLASGTFSGTSTLSTNEMVVCAGSAAQPPTVSGIGINGGTFLVSRLNCSSGESNEVIHTNQYTLEITFDPPWPTNFNEPGMWTFDVLAVGHPDLLPNGMNCGDIELNLGEITVYVPEAQISVDGISDEDEDKVGGIVVVNDDDDNTNTTPDLADTGIVTGENDLLKITVDGTGAPTATNLILSVSSATGAGHVRVWLSPTKNSTAPVLDNAIPAKMSFSIPSSALPLDLWVEGISASIKEGDVQFTASYAGCTDQAGLTVWERLKVDLDVDSDNNNGLGLPDRSWQEDGMEDVSGDPAKPGKIIFANRGDADRDGIPNFADGYGLNGQAAPNESAGFVPMVVSLSRDIDPSQALIRFGYPESDPSFVTTNLSGQWIPAEGLLRVWTTNGQLARSSATAPIGSFVPSDHNFVASDLGFSTTSRSITLFVEAVTYSLAAADGRVTVTVDADGSGPGGFELIDAVRFTGLSAELVEATGDDSAMLRSDFKDSDPSPVITVNQCAVSNVRPNWNGTKLLADVTVAGKVNAAVCDITPGEKGAINRVFIHLNSYEEPLDIGGALMTVTKTTNDHSFLKPYPYEGTFSRTYQSVEVDSGINLIRFVATDSVVGNSGFAEWTFEVSATDLATPSVDYSLLTYANVNVSLDFAGISSLAELTATQTVTLTVQALVSTNPTFSASLRRVSADNATPLVLASDVSTLAAWVIIPNPSQLNTALGTNMAGTVTAAIGMPAILPAITLFNLPETAQDSSHFVHDRPSVVLDSSGALSTNNVDDVTLMVSRFGYTGLTNTLVETGTNSLTFTALGGTNRLRLTGAEFGHTNVDRVQINLTIPALDFSSRGFSLWETDTNSFVFIYAPPLEFYTVASATIGWNFGWEFSVSECSEIARSQGGVLHLHLLQFQGPEDVLDTLSLRDNSGIAIGPDGKHYFSRQGRPADFATVAADNGSVFSLSASGSFLVGFAKGFGMGGVSLIKGTANAVVRGGEWYLSMLLGTEEMQDQAYQQLIDFKRSTAETVTTLATFVTTVATDNADIVASMMHGQWEEANAIAAPYQLAAEYGVELVKELWTEYLSESDFRKGELLGEGMFQVVALAAPYAKAGQVSSAGKLNFLCGLRAASFFQRNPRAAAALERVIDAFETGCFAAGTPVLTESGYKHIEDIEKGELVLARDPVSGEQTFKRVSEVFLTSATELYRLTVRSDATGLDITVQCTENHPFFEIEKAVFVAAQTLRIGDRLSLADMTIATIVSIEKIKEDDESRFTTYNLSIEDYNTFFVGSSGIWVHNSCLHYKRALTKLQSHYWRLRKRGKTPWEASLESAQANYGSSFVEAKGNLFARAIKDGIKEVVAGRQPLFDSSGKMTIPSHDISSEVYRMYTGVKGLSEKFPSYYADHHLVFKEMIEILVRYGRLKPGIGPGSTPSMLLPWEQKHVPVHAVMDPMWRAVKLAKGANLQVDDVIQVLDQGYRTAGWNDEAVVAVQWLNHVRK